MLLGRKAMTNLDRILKSRDITLLTKVRIVKAMVFAVVMFECESWAIKKAKNWRIDAFELWCWIRHLRDPWTARRSKQSILKEINPEGRTDTEAQVPILRPPDVKSWLVRKNPDAGKDWRQEKGMTEDEMVGWHHWLKGHESGQVLEMVKDREAWRDAVHGVTKHCTRLSDWTTANQTRRESPVACTNGWKRERVQPVWISVSLK